MASLVLDILFAAERHLVRRLGRVVLAVVAPLLFLSGAVVWGSVAAYLALSQLTTPTNAALILFGASLLLALLAALALRLRRPARRRDDSLERMVANLAMRDAGDGAHRTEFAALILLLLDGFLGRRRG